MNKILILSSNAGGGHIAISNAVKQYIESQNKSIKIKILNTASKFSSTTYRFIGEYFIDFHKKNWQASNSPKSAKLLHSLYSQLLVPKIAKTIINFNPNLIISTHAFSTIEAKKALKFVKKYIPHIVIIADPFTIHHAWTTYKKADHYLVPTIESKNILIKRNINPKKITITGLPLRLNVYNSKLTTSKARQKLKINPNKFTIFVGGSGEGHGNIYNIVKNLLKHSSIQKKCQLLIITGKNKLLKKRIKNLQKQYPKLIKLYGYTSLIHELLTASNIIIGKPGPNILFESLMLKKPFIATSQPLMQEKGNYDYIQKENLGIVTHINKQTIKTLLNIIKNPEKTEQFILGIKKHLQKYINTPQKTLAVINKFL